MCLHIQEGLGSHCRADMQCEHVSKLTHTYYYSAKASDVQHRPLEESFHIGAAAYLHMCGKQLYISSWCMLCICLCAGCEHFSEVADAGE